jgi:hypothetical protein
MALHCTTPTRIDLLFTMSDNPHDALSEQRMQSDVSRTNGSSIGLPSRSAFRREGWWSLSGSNRRPHACKARALPAELRPHDRKDECNALIVETMLAIRSSRRPVRLRPSRLRPLGYGEVNRATARQPSLNLPTCRAEAGVASEGWWAWEDLNFRPHAYQARALTN